jgi:hypothetical protein
MLGKKMANPCPIATELMEAWLRSVLDYLDCINGLYPNREAQGRIAFDECRGILVRIQEGQRSYEEHCLQHGCLARPASEY